MKKKMYEFKKIYKNKLWIVNGYIGFFCKHCFKPIRFRVKDLIVDQDKNIEEGLRLNNNYKFYCDECKKHNEWEDFIDPNIVGAISLLNKKNYVTQCCCEGHKYEYGDNDAYILFKYKYNNIDESDNLLKWYIDENAYYISDKKKIAASVIRCNLDTPLNKRMEYLNKWVRSLLFNEKVGGD